MNVVQKGQSVADLTLLGPIGPAIEMSFDFGYPELLRSYLKSTVGSALHGPKRIYDIGLGQRPLLERNVEKFLFRELERRYHWIAEQLGKLNSCYNLPDNIGVLANQNPSLALKLIQNALLSQETAPSPDMGGEATVLSDIVKCLRQCTFLRKVAIEANLRLVSSIAGKYASRSNPHTDLVEMGVLGLMKAIYRFRLEHNCRFATYATWWIKQSIRKNLDDNGSLIRVPAYMSESIKKLDRAGALPGNVDKKQLRTEAARQALTSPISISDTSSGTNPVLNRLSASARTPLDEVIDRENSANIKTLLGLLPAREARVVELRYGLCERDPLKLVEIAAELSIFKELVRQLQLRAIEKFRKYVRVHGWSAPE